MKINNLELFFDKQEGTNLLFKTSSGESVAIDKKLLVDFSDKDKKIFLNLDSEQHTNKAQEILNEILETNNE